MVNERQDSLQGLVSLEAVTLLVARELGAEVGDLAQEVYRDLIGQGKDKDDRS